MFDPNDIHIVLIGNDRVLDYRLNMEILRFNFSFSDRLWITTVYNGDPNGLPSGIGENTFIHVPENRGYGYGALDGFNHGLSFAADGYRPIVMIFNFDVWFFTEKGFIACIEDFLEANEFKGAGDNIPKNFSAGFLPDHQLFMTDCMIFDRDLLKKILPLKDEPAEHRMNNPKLQAMYEGTELGFMNMEEWFYGSVDSKLQETKTKLKPPPGFIAHIMQRDGAPRYRWTEKFTLAHSHDYEQKKEWLKQYNTTKGQLIPKFLNGEFG